MESKSIFIDYFRAFLLTGVIVCHLIEIDVQSPLTAVFLILESFLMPVFLAVSGYLLSKTNLKNERWGIFLPKYIKRLIIPFLLALVIERLWRWPDLDLFMTYIELAGQFWYIPTLFIFILFLKIGYTYNFSIVKQVLLYSIFTFLILLDALTIQSFQISYFRFYYFPFFLIGHYWKDFNWKLPRFYTLIFYAIFYATWIFRLITIIFQNEMFGIPRVLTMMSTTLFSINYIHNKAQGITLKRKEFFIYYGRNTLAVYLYHYFVLLIVYTFFKGLPYYMVAIGSIALLISSVVLVSKFSKSDRIIWLFGIKPGAECAENKSKTQPTLQ